MNYLLKKLTMKKTIYLLLIILISSCGNHKDKQSSSDNVSDSLKVSITSTSAIDVEDATYTDFVNAEKNYHSNFLADTLKYVKQKGQLVLPLSTGKEVIFTDTLSPESESIEYRVYGYLGCYPKLNYYLVDGGFYEDHEYYLVDMNSGQINEIAGFPKVSPQLNYLININEIGGMGDEPIGFKILKINNENRSIINFAELEQFDDYEWYPVDFTWENDKTAIIKIISFKSKDYQEENYANSKDCVYKRLKLK